MMTSPEVLVPTLKSINFNSAHFTARDVNGSVDDVGFFLHHVNCHVPAVSRMELIFVYPLRFSQTELNLCPANTAVMQSSGVIENSCVNFLRFNSAKSYLCVVLACKC
jgi:hypothetical protein